jgi:hypothetical protein
MTLGALIGAGVNADAIRDGIASLGLPITLDVQRIRKGGFAAVYVKVNAEDQHQHRHLHHVEAIIDKGALTDGQKQLAKRIFRRLAEAEAAVHGIPVDKVHFHEVGALDSIADVIGAAIGLDLLGVEQFTSRSVPTGHGTVTAAHGIMPIPAPGTAELLKGVPLAPSPIHGELTTPTGAAILTSVVKEWTETPALRVDRIGYGAGTKDFKEQANVLRLLVGEAGSPVAQDQVWVIETNLDHVSAEIIGYTLERLFTAGAVDAFAQPLQMKKNRPGTLLTVLAPADALARVEEVLFRETGTLGIRRHVVERHKLERQPRAVATPWGTVQGKLAWRPGQKPQFAPEYDDCARVARTYDVPLREVYEVVCAAFKDQNAG